VTAKARPLAVWRDVDLGRMNRALFQAGRTQLPSQLANHFTEVSLDLGDSKRRAGMA
jgi:hypothetical protein